ncbi:DUF2306 domain-containing protein [Algirhabdus cladophorae]|uniref:DUF2306 domain-containing protein n=1 Tax=Algirhabdus cladophorae TaxID=3377108 RepID=UPI003B8498F1
MTLSPLLDAPLILQLHVAAAIPAILIGPFVLFRKRVDRWHKRLGYTWVVAMAALAIFGLFIQSHGGLWGHFGPLHGFSILTLWSLWTGIAHARAGRIHAHRATFQGLWYGGIGGAGLMQFLPGRTINQMVFGGPSELGYVVIGLGVCGFAALWYQQHGPAFGKTA